MITSSPLLHVSPAQGSPAIPWANLARTADLQRRHGACSPTEDTGGALQMLMAELIKGRQGVRPAEPLPVESQEGRRSWLIEAWTFPDFHVVEIATARLDSAHESWSTKFEFVPVALR